MHPACGPRSVAARHPHLRALAEAQPNHVCSSTVAPHDVQQASGGSCAQSLHAPVLFWTAPPCVHHRGAPSRRLCPTNATCLPAHLAVRRAVDLYRIGDAIVAGCHPHAAASQDVARQRSWQLHARDARLHALHQPPCIRSQKSRAMRPRAPACKLLGGAYPPHNQLAAKAAARHQTLPARKQRQSARSCPQHAAVQHAARQSRHLPPGPQCVPTCTQSVAVLHRIVCMLAPSVFELLHKLVKPHTSKREAHLAHRVHSCTWPRPGATAPVTPPATGAT